MIVNFNMNPRPEMALGVARALVDLKVGERARVLAVSEPGPTGEGLLEMGLTPGTEVLLVRRSLLGRVLQIGVRGYHLSLQAKTAEQIRVEG
jgi:Fe2+ transport system protein FeoA